MWKTRFFLAGCVAIFATAAFAGVGMLNKTAKTITAFDARCTTDPAAILPRSGITSYTSVRCGNPSAAPVYIGGADVTTSDGYPLCSDTRSCPEMAATFNVGVASCRVALGTVSIKCFALSE